jgi:hypothetical protein
MRNRLAKISDHTDRLLLWLAAWLLGLMASHLAAAESLQRFPARATVRFAATSTLHDFGGQLPAQPFLIVISNGTWSASADVLSSDMDTASEKRDRNMHRMLGTNDYPRIHGEVAGAPIPVLGETNAMLRLRIRDRTNDLPARISAWQDTPEEIQFHAEWDLSLKAFGLKPPSVVGVIRVGDRVRLEADVRASKTSPPSSATAFKQ